VFCQVYFLGVVVYMYIIHVERERERERKHTPKVLKSVLGEFLKVLNFCFS